MWNLCGNYDLDIVYNFYSEYYGVISDDFQGYFTDGDATFTVTCHPNGLVDVFYNSPFEYSSHPHEGFELRLVCTDIPT